MAFRRRGYERDALLHAVVERAGFAHLVREEEQQQRRRQQLATLPEELSRFDLERYHDRPVQAEVIELLLLLTGDDRFTTCVLIHKSANDTYTTLKMLLP